MKQILSAVLFISMIFFSCKKDSGGKTNRPPVANAGPDQRIILPTNTVAPDGSASTDPDNNIASYLWTKISGPSSFNIASPNAVQTQVINLVEGVYQFELEVTDAGGLFDRDTVQVIVERAIVTTCDNSNRPIVNAQLIFIGTLPSILRTGMSVAAAGNKILFAGGGTPDLLSSAAVSIYDITSDTWSTANLSAPRQLMAVVAAGNKIFFGGGIVFDGSGSNYRSNVVDIYDVTTNTWTVTHLSRAAWGLAATTVGNKVFFTGDTYIDKVDIYDLTTNTWSTASLSAPRVFGITTVSTNNKAYFTGGEWYSSGNGNTSNVIDIYDATTGSWSTSTLQVPRYQHTATAVNNILYFAGGLKTNVNGGGDLLCSVETLNTNTGARTTMNLSDPAAFVQNAVVKDNKIVFYPANYANRFDIYDIQTNAWSIGVLSQTEPVGASVISVNNIIYVAGGSVNGSLSDKVYKLEF